MARITKSIIEKQTKIILFGGLVWGNDYQVVQ